MRDIKSGEIVLSRLSFVCCDMLTYYYWGELFHFNPVVFLTLSCYTFTKLCIM